MDVLNQAALDDADDQKIIRERQRITASKLIGTDAKGSVTIAKRPVAMAKASTTV